MPFHVRGKLRRHGSRRGDHGRIGRAPNNDNDESTKSDSLDPACVEGAMEAKKQYETVYGSSSSINNGSARSTSSGSSSSHIADKTMEFPRFRFEELSLGAVLGQGGFGKVYEIRSITCREAVTLTQLSQSDVGGYASSGGGGGGDGGGGINGHDSLSLHDLGNDKDVDTSDESAEVHGFFSQLDERNFKENRAFIAKHCLRQPSCNNVTNGDNSNHGGSSDGTKQLGSTTGGSTKNLFSSSSNPAGGGGKLVSKKRKQRDARYAIKFLKPEIIKNPNVYPSACYDMALETRVLSSIVHPNIIKLRAISSVPTFSKDYFFITDRLYDTLEQRISKWKRTMKRSNNVIGKLLTDRNGAKVETVTLDRMVSAFDLSSAIAYIHKQHIIFRDLVSICLVFFSQV